jgi:hypothetical protein
MTLALGDRGDHHEEDPMKTLLYIRRSEEATDTTVSLDDQ